MFKHSDDFYIVSHSQLRKALAEFTVALPVSCLNSEADVFGKCLSAAGSHEYFCCTGKQQAVSHGAESRGLLGSTVKVSHRTSVCAFVPHTRLSVPLRLWQCTAAVNKANPYVHKKKHDVIPVSVLCW